MSTEQMYVGKGDNVPSTEQTATTATQTAQNGANIFLSPDERQQDKTPVASIIFADDRPRLDQANQQVDKLFFVPVQESLLEHYKELHDRTFGLFDGLETPVMTLNKLLRFYLVRLEGSASIDATLVESVYELINHFEIVRLLTSEIDYYEGHEIKAKAYLNQKGEMTMNKINQQAANKPEIAFEPAFINVPVYLKIYDRDEDNAGDSQLSVLAGALKAYKKEVSSWHDIGDKQNTLDMIDELQDTVIDVMCTRLDESGAILHEMKHFSGAVEQSESLG